MVGKQKNKEIIEKRFTKSFLDIFRDCHDSKRFFLGFINVGASWQEAIQETAKYYKIDPEYEIF